MNEEVDAIIRGAIARYQEGAQRRHPFEPREMMSTARGLLFLSAFRKKPKGMSLLDPTFRRLADDPKGLQDNYDQVVSACRRIAAETRG